MFIGNMHSVWDQIKLFKYRYDVTLPLYCMTTSERVILNTFILLFIILIAVSIFRFPISLSS
ncbi:hypothetical protein V1512DRAFT_259477 [Lipomyces arxii]|uniref:uncharacterized protein n=1 Tax=Lipomyces arxii TaxID=56418 RepID=UPI0034CE1B63